MWNYSDTSRVSCIGSDNYQAGRLIASHLLELGHRDIALVFPETIDNDRAADRLNGAVDCLSDAGITVQDDWRVNTLYSIKHARAASQKLFSSAKHPTAVIAGNDVIAQGVFYAAMSNGLAVPDDVSVAGIGDFSGSADLLPSLSTVRLRSNAIGKRAAEVLIQNVNGETGSDPTRIAVELELKQRESTKVC
jgi:LacI family transcriptional regulator